MARAAAVARASALFRQRARLALADAAPSPAAAFLALVGWPALEVPVGSLAPRWDLQYVLEKSYRFSGARGLLFAGSALDFARSADAGKKHPPSLPDAPLAARLRSGKGQIVSWLHSRCNGDFLPLRQGLVPLPGSAGRITQVQRRFPTAGGVAARASTQA